MIGVIVTAFNVQLYSRWILLLIILLVSALGTRTFVRDFDWRNQYTLASQDIKVSKQDYNADDTIAQHYISQGNYGKAAVYLRRSISVLPTFNNYNDLGIVLAKQGSYQGAVMAFNQGLRYGDDVSIYQNLTTLALLYGTPSANSRLFKQALDNFPDDSTLWVNLAIYEDKYGDHNDAQLAIAYAVHYGKVNETLYKDIAENHPFTLNLAVFGQTIKVQ